MLLQLSGHEFQCVYLWVDYKELSVHCSIHWGKERCPVSLLFARTNIVVSFHTPFSWLPLGFISFAFCSSLFLCCSLLPIYLVFLLFLLLLELFFQSNATFYCCRDCWLYQDDLFYSLWPPVWSCTFHLPHQFHSRQFRGTLVHMT